MREPGGKEPGTEDSRRAGRSGPGEGPSRPDPPFVLLHPAGEDRPPLLLRDPVRIVAAREAGEVSEALEAGGELWARGLWVAGFVAYEAASGLDPALETRPPGPLPLVWMAAFESPTATAEARGLLDGAGSWRVGEWSSTRPPDDYRDAVAALRASIRDGDFYQVNHTCRLRADFTGDGLGLYRSLHRAQGGGLHAYLGLGRHEIASASPELFLRREGRRLATRPMKGTAPRGRWPGEDRRRGRTLARSEKDRAENLMILDMARNDLSRVCRAETVEVPELWAVERFPTVWQMTSTAAGELEPGAGPAEVFRALFPAASVTGAPKPAAMARIARDETAPRGVYCGALGLMAPADRAVEAAGSGPVPRGADAGGGSAHDVVSPGSWTFSVGIRTAWIDREAGTVEYGTGGGVTWDSDPEAERLEAEVKAAVLGVPGREFRLLETLRLEDGRLARRGRHLARLADSADYFGFAPPGREAERALEEIVARRPTGRWRVRLTAGPEGACDVEAVPFPEGPEEPAPVGLAREPVDAADPMLFHKTTRRAPYRERRTRRPDCFDVVLRNGEGRATELTRGNLVVELDGRRVTPPREDGLLAGTLRAELIEAGELEVGPVPGSRLAAADRLWMINSLRGWLELALVDDPGDAGSP